MPRAGCAAAYLITTFVMSPRGEVRLEGETVCFDLCCALDMARSDCEWAAGACVYALDLASERGNPRLVAGFGLLASSGKGRHAVSPVEIRHIA
ncbi:hypothetical protein [Xanthobacter sp. KR7-225]|uniref:hypothetical protein n=1 Tax=Xanthobacter sp. KR7-225 TaxID=3156613 RepID=UPI0032B31D5F